MENRVEKYTCRLTANELHAPQQRHESHVRQQLPQELGNCYTESIMLESGILVGRLHYHPDRPIVEETLGPHQGRVIVVTVGLQGQSVYRGDNTPEVLFKAGHTTVTSFQALRGERSYEGSKPVSQLRVVISASTLRKYVGDERVDKILGDSTFQRLAFYGSSSATLAHAAAINRYMKAATGEQPNPHQLELHIHALSLLSEQFKALAPIQTEGYSAFSSEEVQRLERARDMIAHQLHLPLTNQYLAAQVGMNENKLKEGFRYLYNNTPSGVVLELRMRKAYTLLESGQQVAQTAWQVGYKYPNNFSVAFMRYYGKSPKTVFQKRA
ncbi:AraC family transcriptional regulator [Advenella sp. S44]|nr:AraC family transcriptional regulator [Advenella sp. S44]